MRAVAAGAALILTVTPTPARAAGTWLVPPVDAPIARHFEAPRSDYGRGHRGIDYATSPGTPVRAAAPGEVTFAGRVAKTKAVTIAHPNGLETTYTFLADVYVSAGDPVAQGTFIGASGEGHPGGPSGIHFGLRQAGRYLDPRDHLGPLDPTSAIRLVSHREEIGDSGRRECTRPDRLAAGPRPPNQNVAVAVAGIGSRTDGGLGAEIYRHGPELLGYPEERVYRFSYKGAENETFHQPYQRADTYGSIRAAAARLRLLLEKIARRHPSASVDLIAHSQGGIVARAMLSSIADRWSPDLPRIAHLVTLASPHRGAPLAEAARDIDEDSLTGGLLLGAASHWSGREGPLPDPRSPAVKELAAGSELIDGLLSEDVAYGTRTLALAMPHDLVVPADRALLPAARSHVLPPEGANGHAEIVRSWLGRGVIYDFLRDAAPACPGAWDRLGPVVGRGISWAEGRLPDLYRRAEDALGGRVPGAAGAVGKRIGRLVFGG